MCLAVCGACVSVCRVPAVCRSHARLVVSFPWSCHVRRCEREACSFGLSLSGEGAGGQGSREHRGGAATALGSLYTEDASVTVPMRLRCHASGSMTSVKDIWELDCGVFLTVRGLESERSAWRV